MKMPVAEPIHLSMGEYCEHLEKRGFKEINKGAFATIYVKAGDKKTVTKIGYVDDDSYIKYVCKVGLNSKNPHFPKIKDVKIYDQDTSDPYSKPYYIVVLERLRPISSVPRKKLTQYLNRRGAKRLYDLSDTHIHRVTPRTKNFKVLVHTLNKLYHMRGVVGDMHSGNVMIRGANTGRFSVVVTDPVV